MAMTTHVHSIRSLHAFTHGVNGRSRPTCALLRGLSERSGRRLHRPTPIDRSTGGSAARGSRATRPAWAHRAKEGERWQ
jgi:hypothetical protein